MREERAILKVVLQEQKSVTPMCSYFFVNTKWIRDWRNFLTEYPPAIFTCLGKLMIRPDK